MKTLTAFSALVAALALSACGDADTAYDEAEATATPVPAPTVTETQTTVIDDTGDSSVTIGPDGVRADIDTDGADVTIDTDGAPSATATIRD